MESNLEYVIQAGADHQHQSQVQTQRGIDAPVNYRENKQEKLLGPQEGNGLHGRFQRCPQVLK